MKEQILPTQPLTMDKSTLAYWKAEVRASFTRQTTEFTEPIGYADLIKYLEGNQSPQGALWCILDEFSPAIISVANSVYYQNPTVQVEASNPDADKPIKPSLEFLLMNPDFRPFNQADLLRGALVYGMKKGGMKEEMQVATYDLLLAGFACVETNHTTNSSQEQPTTDMDYEQSSGNPAIINKLVDGAKSLISRFTGEKEDSSKSHDEVAKEVAETTQKDIYTDSTNETYVKRYDPRDILFDPRARVFKESRWVGKVVRMTKAEFDVKYPQFKNKVNIGDDSPSLAYTSHELEANRKCVTLIEIEIKKRGPRNCVLVLNLGCDEAIDYYERPIISNDFAIKYGCVDKYGVIYPMSRGRKAKKPQDDINHYMTVMFEHVDRAQRKIAYYEGGLTDSGKTAQRSSDVYALVEKKIPGPVYEAMPAPSVVPENKEIVGAMRESINKSVGTTELAKTGNSENDTLGQDELQMQSFQSNVNSIQDALQDIADQVLDEMKDIILQLWDGEDYFKVTGIKGGDTWYSPEMGPLADILIGDYNVNCNIASAARPNPLKDRKELMEMNAMITNPKMVQFAMLHGKRPSMETLNNLIKTFNMNPEMVFEDIEPQPEMPQPLQPPSPISPTPNANLVQSEGNSETAGAAPISLGAG